MQEVFTEKRKTKSRAAQEAAVAVRTPKTVKVRRRIRRRKTDVKSGITQTSTKKLRAENNAEFFVDII